MSASPRREARGDVRTTRARERSRRSSSAVANDSREVCSSPRASPRASRRASRREPERRARTEETLDLDRRDRARRRRPRRLPRASMVDAHDGFRSRGAIARRLGRLARARPLWRRQCASDRRSSHVARARLARARGERARGGARVRGRHHRVARVVVDDARGDDVARGRSRGAWISSETTRERIGDDDATVERRS